MPTVEMVVLQSTPFCNIDCRYCYLPDRSSKAKMSLDTIRQVFVRLFSSGWYGATLDVLWHAGEPLVLPVEYYREAHSLIRSMTPEGTRLDFCFQTNATLLDDEWCLFFRNSDIKMGVSIDGPREINDKYRLTRSGKSTFEETLAGIRRLRQHGVPFSVISVLSATSLQHAKELHDFYAAEGIKDVCFNVEEVEGSHKASSLQSQDIEVRYESFMREFWNVTTTSKALNSIREFRQMLQNIVSSKDAEIHNTLVTPFAMLNVDYNGNFSTFSPEFLGHKSARYKDFIFGNVWDTALEDSIKSEAFKEFNADVQAGVALCRTSCSYFSVCGGGSPSNKLYENGSLVSTETLHCRLHKQVLANMALEVIEASAATQGDASERLDADIYILGAGISFPEHLTSQTVEIMRGCARVLTNIPDRQLTLLPPDLRNKCESLWHLYKDQRRRIENYRDVTQAIVDAAGDKPIAWLTPGHPRVFDSVSDGLMRAGRARGWDVRIIPAVSSIDTALAELDYDPADGLLIHDATSFVLSNMPAVTNAATLLLQPSVFCVDIAHLSGNFSGPDLTRLRDHLARFYPPEHRCAFIRSGTEAGDEGVITWTLLENMTALHYDKIAGSSLFVPPLEWEHIAPQADAEQSMPASLASHS